VSGLDRRHRWGEPVREGARAIHTCASCGKVVTFELLIPDAVADAILAQLSRPNLYRSIVNWGRT
jgi:hypothetical protein